MLNCFEDMPLFTNNVKDMLNDELKPNFGDQSRTTANLSAPTLGGMSSFAPAFKQF